MLRSRLLLADLPAGPAVIAAAKKVAPRLKKKATSALGAKCKAPLRVCILSPTYEGTDSPTAEVDGKATPEFWVKDKKSMQFDFKLVNKLDAFKFVRDNSSCGNYDCFFNLCDGAREEKRAGVDVVEALEYHNAAFTGADSRSFEVSKIDMKLLVASAGVNTPNFVLLKDNKQIAKKCRHLKFPVIVKNVSGYASVGIDKDNKCDNFADLEQKLRSFIPSNNHALVEEFIRGREGTALVCADPTLPDGIRVFRPTMFDFLSTPDDFAHFESKWDWKAKWSYMALDDPAMAKVVNMTKNAFKYIMSGVGYGRCDFRIADNGSVYFLEINANCSMWSDPEKGGDYADLSVMVDKDWNHDTFAINAIQESLRQKAAREPWIVISHDAKGNFTTRASSTVAAGKALFGDLIHPIPVVARAIYNIAHEDPSVGCVVQRGDGQHQSVAIRHSCEPNMTFMHGRTLTFVARRTINEGEELTVDYATLRDESMPRFACSCGTRRCRGVVWAMQAMPRQVDSKRMKRLLREKKRAWMALADTEAEKIVTKRSEREKRKSSAKGSSGKAAGEATPAAAPAAAAAASVVPPPPSAAAVPEKEAAKKPEAPTAAKKEAHPSGKAGSSKASEKSETQ